MRYEIRQIRPNQMGWTVVDTIKNVKVMGLSSIDNAKAYRDTLNGHEAQKGN